MDAVSDRDFVVELSGWATLLMAEQTPESVG